MSAKNIIRMAKAGVLKEGCMKRYGKGGPFAAQVFFLISLCILAGIGNIPAFAAEPKLPTQVKLIFDSNFLKN
jgi:hypothetical protein